MIDEPWIKIDLGDGVIVYSTQKKWDEECRLAQEITKKIQEEYYHNLFNESTDRGV